MSELNLTGRIKLTADTSEVKKSINNLPSHSVGGGGQNSGGDVKKIASSISSAFDHPAKTIVDAVKSSSSDLGTVLKNTTLTYKSAHQGFSNLKGMISSLTEIVSLMKLWSIEKEGKGIQKTTNKVSKSVAKTIENISKPTSKVAKTIEDITSPIKNVFNNSVETKPFYRQVKAEIPNYNPPQVSGSKENKEPDSSHITSSHMAEIHEFILKISHDFMKVFGPAFSDVHKRITTTLGNHLNNMKQKSNDLNDKIKKATFNEALKTAKGLNYKKTSVIGDKQAYTTDGLNDIMSAANDATQPTRDRLDLAQKRYNPLKAVESFIKPPEQSFTNPPEVPEAATKSYGGVKNTWFGKLKHHLSDLENFRIPIEKLKKVHQTVLNHLHKHAKGGISTFKKINDVFKVARKGGFFKKTKSSSGGLEGSVEEGSGTESGMTGTGAELGEEEVGGSVGEAAGGAALGGLAAAGMAVVGAAALIAGAIAGASMWIESFGNKLAAAGGPMQGVFAMFAAKTKIMYQEMGEKLVPAMIKFKQATFKLNKAWTALEVKIARLLIPIVVKFINALTAVVAWIQSHIHIKAIKKAVDNTAKAVFEHQDFISNGLGHAIFWASKLLHINMAKSVPQGQLLPAKLHDLTKAQLGSHRAIMKAMNNHEPSSLKSLNLTNKQIPELKDALIKNTKAQLKAAEEQKKTRDEANLKMDELAKSMSLSSYFSEFTKSKSDEQYMYNQKFEAAAKAVESGKITMDSFQIVHPHHKGKHAKQ